VAERRARMCWARETRPPPRWDGGGWTSPSALMHFFAVGGASITSLGRKAPSRRGRLSPCVAHAALIPTNGAHTPRPFFAGWRPACDSVRPYTSSPTVTRWILRPRARVGLTAIDRVCGHVWPASRHIPRSSWAPDGDSSAGLTPRLCSRRLVHASYRLAGISVRVTSACWRERAAAGGRVVGHAKCNARADSEHSSETAVGGFSPCHLRAAAAVRQPIHDTASPHTLRRVCVWWGKIPSVLAAGYSDGLHEVRCQDAEARRLGSKDPRAKHALASCPDASRPCSPASRAELKLNLRLKVAAKAPRCWGDEH
jgi:hypothetical protein